MPMREMTTCWKPSPYHRHPPGSHRPTHGLLTIYPAWAQLMAQVTLPWLETTPHDLMKLDGDLQQTTGRTGPGSAELA